MKNILESIRNFYSLTNNEVRWWAYAAWTAPFTALVLIFLLDQIGWSDGVNRLVVISGIVIFTVAVYWWWWAIFKVSRMAGLLLNTAEQLKNISKDLREINQNLSKEDK